jgi:quinol monooxygenase YgiN
MKTKLLVLVFSLVLISSSYGNKKTGENSLKTGNLIQVPATDYGMMIVAKLTVKPDKVKAFAEAAKEIIEKSNKEAGCKSYQLYQDPYDNTKFVFVEEYKNQAAIDAHFASNYFKNFGPVSKDWLNEPTEIKIYDIAGVK